MARQKNWSYQSYDEAEDIAIVGNYVWDTGTLAWIKQVSVAAGGGGLTDTQLRATPVPVSGPLTDTQLRATPVPVSGAVTTGGLTDTQLRASSVPVSLAANQTVNVALVAGVAPSLNTGVRDAGTRRVTIATNDVVPVTGAFFQATQPVSNVSLPLPAGAATETTLDVRSGSLTEVAPATDTASSGLNGRLQRIAQRLTSLIALLPAALVGGRLDTNVGAWLGSVAPTVAQKTMASSLPVVIASDQTAVTVSGTVTVTPPTLTKGTQGATGFSVQDLKDAGRNQTHYFSAIQIVTTATDALLSLTGFKGGVAVAATTTPAVVTAGKTYRVTSITLDYTSIVTTEGAVRFTLRANLSGVVAIGSPAVNAWEIGQTGSGVSVAGKKNTVTLSFPDGMEFAAGTGIGISQVGLSPVGAAAIAGYGRVSITGYEY